MKEQIKRLILSAIINFENLEKVFPMIVNIPIYNIAKLQLDEAMELEEQNEKTN